MSFYLEVDGIQSEPFHVTLEAETHVLGSSNRCDMHFQHAELEPRALQVDVRADDVWLQNLNPYPIYVGDEEVATNGWASWELSKTVQLTRNISVTLHKRKKPENNSLDSASKESAANGLDVSKIVQMVVAGACFLISPLILFSGNGEAAGVQSESTFDFEEIVDTLEIGQSHREIQVVRDNLQRAWMADQRWSRSKDYRGLVVQRYRQLIKLRLMRETDLTISELDDDEMIALQKTRQEGLSEDVVSALVDIKQLAQRRLADLDAQ